MELFTLFVLVLDATLRVSTPLILAALAGLYAERSGVFDIGLEGKMLAAAFAAAAAAAVTHSAWVGLAAGIGASVALALVHGFACITHRGNQIVSGVAINTLVAGLAPTLGIAWFARGGQTPPLSNPEPYQGISLPFVPMNEAQAAEQLRQAGLTLNDRDMGLVLDGMRALPPDEPAADSVGDLVGRIIDAAGDIGNRTTGRLERAAQAADEQGGIEAVQPVIDGLAADSGGVLAWFFGGIQDLLNGLVSFVTEERFTAITLPFADAVADVPIIGLLYSELLSGHNILVYAALAAVPLTAWVVYRTRFGLRLRAVGENPAAVDTAGISVNWMRYKALLICGALCGVAGTYLSVAQNASFVRDMTAGKGFVALAALIFAKWRPVPVLLACLLFGFLEAIESRLQGVDLPGIGQVPVQFIQALPYILTVVLLAGFIGKAVAPKAGGIPYVKER